VKNKRILLLLIPIILIIVIAFSIKSKRDEFVLELGVFAGSNWNVVNEDYYKFINQAITQFEEENPNVKVHYYSGIRKDDYSEWLAQQILQGDSPDVMMVLSKDFNTLSSLGVLENLDSHIKKDNDVSIDDFFDFAINAGTHEGHLYGLPCEVNPKMMAINKTLLEQQGYDIPKNDWTWDDFYALCKSMTKDINEDGNLDIFGVCNYNWTDAVYSDGATLFNQMGTKAYFNDMRVIESVRFMQKLSTLNKNTVLSKDDFDSGKVAFMPLTFAEYKTYTTYPYKIEKYLNIEWEFISMPSGPNGSNISKADTLLLAISKNSKHKKMAYELLKTFTTNEDIQIDLYKYAHGASPYKSVAASDKVDLILNDKMAENDMKYNPDLIIEILNNSVITSKFRKHDEVMALADKEIQSIINDDKNADSSLRKFQRIISQKLE
jgi:multiple sugar transport system substrate-binding protein